uniref:Uncharacterized protein n=1 Tax=Pyxicephalus adspersus TaxID=30357 RepID=A0AAV3BAU1_PYXAD|nr:TPA: hypothetical protein GDO54_000989 [Pyxicephalus adspersus]
MYCISFRFSSQYLPCFPHIDLCMFFSYTYSHIDFLFLYFYTTALVQKDLTFFFKSHIFSNIKISVYVIIIVHLYDYLPKYRSLKLHCRKHY